MCKNWQTAQIFEIPNKAENVEAIVMYYTHYQSRQMTHIKIEKAANKFLLSNCTLHQFCVNKKCLSPLKFRFSKKATKFETISHMIWRLLKVRQIRNDFFKPTFLPKNEQTNSTLLLVDLFSFVFRKKVKTPKRHFNL